MKILISAYACETGRGSEGEIAWRMVHEFARYHDVRVNLPTQLVFLRVGIALVSQKSRFSQWLAL